MADPNTPISVQIPQRGYQQLEQLALHSAQLEEVVNATRQLRANVDSTEMAEQVGRLIQNEQRSEPMLVLSGLATLRNLMDSTGADADSFLETLTRSLPVGAPPLWLARNLERWNAARPTIARAINSITPEHPLLLRQKALELTYAHQNIFRQSRIITDLRPVFDVTGGEIAAIVLTHVLSIEYFDGVRRQRIEFALDTTDVKALRESAARAEVKTATTRRRFGGDEWSLIVAGETDQGPE